MAGYAQFCPISRASEVFAERWTPLILRELMTGRHHFSEIVKGVHHASPSMIAARLRTLERVGVVETRPNPTGRGSTYYLTEAGAQLAAIVRDLGVWGQRWLEVGPQHLDPDFLMWAIFSHLDPARLPPRREVVRFEIRGIRKRYWLVLLRDDPDICYSDPRFGDDLVVRADLEGLVRVYLGHILLEDARRMRLIELEGSREVVRRFGEWLPRSGFAPAAPKVRYDATSASFVQVPA